MRLRYYHSFLAIAILLTGTMVNISPSHKVLAASDLRITAVGDWGCTGNTLDTVKNAKNLNPNLVLALGDYSYGNTPGCWFDAIRPIGPMTKINFGNHEVESDTLLNSYLKNFGLSRQYYSYNIGNVHVLTMATEETFSTGSQQYNFVVKDLEAASIDSNIKWIIVNLHTPIYASPNTCDDSGCAGDKTLRDIYHPLFDKYGVDLVLEGHIHNYQRSYPIGYNSLDSSSPLVTNCSKNSYSNPDGQIYAVVGTGGVNLHGLSGKASFMASQQDSKFGILDMRFSNNKLDANFISNDGSMMDQFSITKTVKKAITEAKFPVQNQHCTDLQTFNVKTQNEFDSSVALRDQIPDKFKKDKLLPNINNEIKQKIDKKLQEVEKKIEQKRQEIQRRLDGINKDTAQDKGNKIEDKTQERDIKIDNLKQRINERLKSRLSVPTFPFP